MAIKSRGDEQVARKNSICLKRIVEDYVASERDFFL